MKTRDEVINCFKENKEQLAKKYPLMTMPVFGSYARQEQTEESDIDILVEFSEPEGIELIGLALADSQRSSFRQ